MYIIITNLGIKNRIEPTQKTTKIGNLEERLIAVEIGRVHLYSESVA